jgi:hypothetical protein
MTVHQAGWLGWVALVVTGCPPGLPAPDAGQAVERSLTLGGPAGPVRGVVWVDAVPEPLPGARLVEFRLDQEQEVRARDITPPHAWRLDTATLPDGPHVVRATATWEDGASAQAEATLTTDNTGPVVVVELPAAHGRVPPPGLVTVMLAAQDGSGVTGGTVSLDDLPATSLQGPGLNAALVLAPTRRFPVPHTLAWWVQDTLGNTTPGGMALTYTHERAALDLTQEGHLGLVPHAGGRFLILTESGITSHARDGTLAWGYVPPGRVVVSALPAPGGATYLGVLSRVDGTLRVQRVDGLGALTWQAPWQGDSAGFQDFLFHQATEMVLGVRAFYPLGAQQTGTLVQVGADGTEQTLATLDEDHLGVALSVTRQESAQGAVAVLEARWDGAGPVRVACWAPDGARLWSTGVSSPGEPRGLFALDTTTAVLAQDPGSGPQVRAWGATGQRWAVLPQPDEELVAGMAMPNGDFLLRSQVAHQTGRLRRIRPDGTVVHDTALESMVRAWQRAGDGVVVALGTQALRLDARGVATVSWELVEGVGLVDPVVLEGVVPLSDGGMLVVASGSARGLMHRVAADGSTTWTEVLPGGEVEAVLPLVGEDGAGVMTFREMTPSGARKTVALYVP